MRAHESETSVPSPGGGLAAQPAARGRFLSVGTKLVVSVIWVLVVLTVVVYVGLAHSEREKLLAAKEKAARMAGELFLRAAATPVIFDDLTGIKDTVNLLAQEPEVLGVELWRATANQGLGVRLARRLKLPTEGGLPPRWVGQPAIERRADRLVLRAPVLDQDAKVIAVAAIQYSLERENAAYGELRRRILIGAATLVAFISLLLIMATRRWITVPLKTLLGSIRQVEAGQRISTWTGSATDEVGRLAAAFGRMAEAVDSREKAIAKRNDDMNRVLDNVGDGFLALDANGCMANERSAVVDRWFSAPGLGQNIADYLRPVDSTFAGLVACGLEAIRDDVLPLELNLAQMPKVFRHEGRHFRCKYHPVLGCEGGPLQKLVMVISDFTSEVERDRAEEVQRDLMAGLLGLLADRAGFLSFLEEADALVGRIADPAHGQEQIDTLMRDVHTLKGTCAIFGLGSMASYCHTLEDRMHDRSSIPSLAEREALKDRWAAFSGKVGIFSGNGRNTVELQPEEYTAFNSALGARAPYEQLTAVVATWLDDPVMPRLERLAEHARSLGQRLGKAPIEVDFGSTQMRLPREPWSQLWGVLVHLVRNAVDHGIEKPEERAAAGKPPSAHMSLTAAANGDNVIITIADDGRGIDWEGLRRKAEAAGLAAESRAQLVEAMCSEGISTRSTATETSGRGVGLAALGHVVRRLDGELTLESEPGKGARFVLRFPCRAPCATLGSGETSRTGEVHATAPGPRLAGRQLR
jgi:HAMP domain-containing protein/HPt (histidine-containing phosphotransfer) domain-containing protein